MRRSNTPFLKLPNFDQAQSFVNEKCEDKSSIEDTELSGFLVEISLTCGGIH